MLVGARAEVYSWVGLRKGYSTKLPLIRRWRCGARVVEEPGLQRPDSHEGAKRRDLFLGTLYLSPYRIVNLTDLSVKCNNDTTTTVSRHYGPVLLGGA